MAINSIGPFTFTTMDGPPDTVKNMVQVLRRPGVAGAAIWNMGQMSQPFQIRTGLDTPSFFAARSYFPLYADLIGREAQQIVFSNYDMTTEGFLVVVQNVVSVPGKTKALLGGVGGLSSPSLGWIEADWTLVPIPIIQQ